MTENWHRIAYQRGRQKMKSQGASEPKLQLQASRQGPPRQEFGRACCPGLRFYACDVRSGPPQSKEPMVRFCKIVRFGQSKLSSPPMTEAGPAPHDASANGAGSGSQLTDPMAPACPPHLMPGERHDSKITIGKMFVGGLGSAVAEEDLRVDPAPACATEFVLFLKC